MEHRIVVFHHDDIDGRAAAAILVNYFEGSHPVKCFEVNYSTSLPIQSLDKKDIVYIVDFTPQKDKDFQAIVDATERVVWIDHHGNNIKEHTFFDKCLEGKRVQKTPSGAKCCWEYIYPNEPAPEAIDLISDFDCWEFNYGVQTKRFMEGLKSYEHFPTSEIWKDLLDETLMSKKIYDEILKRGETIRNFQKNYFQDIIEQNAFTCDFEGHRILACNMPNIGSTLFEYIDTDEFLITCTFSSNGTRTEFGIYTEHPEIDCSEIAKKYGGGGHRGASGFEHTVLPFENICPYKP